VPTTLKELAARAKVHPSTISRVVNQDPSLRVAPATRARIEALLRETEYRPNGVARGLKLRQTLVLAALLPLSLRDALAKLPALTSRLEPPQHELAQLQLPLFRAGEQRRRSASR